MNEEGNPWEQLPDEPDVWFDRFDAYRLLGAARTIEEVFRSAKGGRANVQGKRPSRHWYDHAAEWNWEERAGEWDAHLREIAEEEELERWRTRHKQYREDLFQIADRVKGNILKMLDMPLVELEKELAEVDSDGRLVKKITIWKPAGWNYASIARLQKELRELDEMLFAGVDEESDPIATEHHVTLVRDNDYTPPAQRHVDPEEGMIEDEEEEED